MGMLLGWGGKEYIQNFGSESCWKFAAWKTEKQNEVLRYGVYLGWVMERCGPVAVSDISVA
jgi:hypothetical protein